VVPANGLRPQRSVALLCLLLSACAPDTYNPGELPPAPDASAGDGRAGSGGPNFPQTGINTGDVTVTSVQPEAGPFAGGNIVVVRGSGFTDDALVYFDGHLVQPADTVKLDGNSLQVVVPAGRVGTVSVEVEIQGERTTLEDAYSYSPLLLEPTRGSIAGGTSVTITLRGARFDSLVKVEFADSECRDLEVITPNQVRCKAPPGKAGAADVVAYWPDDDDKPRLIAEDAYEYVDLADTDRGGLSGGPIEGTLNITVVEPNLGFAVPGAFVLVGDDLDGPHQGLTDENGQITFSGEGLSGPVNVHASAHCMERASIVAFNAANVTIYLPMLPPIDPSCGMPGEPSAQPPGRGTLGSFISGELIFPSSDEFAIAAWDVVPPPRRTEVRVTYVFTTRSHVYAPNPSPAVSGSIARIVESTSVPGVHGYPYRIFARPAGLAVYALSGLERRDTGEFVPYVMGVTRDVVTAPGVELGGVDIYMDIPLDRELQAAVSNLPKRTPRGPDQFRVQAHIDLGGEGVIVRQVNGWGLDLKTSVTGGSLFRFFAQPALVSNLSDARYQVIAGWYTGDRDADETPFTEVRMLGVDQTAEPVAIDDLLAIPVATAPLAGGRVPDDRVVRWSMDPERTPPDLYEIEIVGGDGLRAWRQIVPGTQTESPIPDLSSVDGLSDIPAGVITWQVTGVRIAGFQYDEFKYEQLASPRFRTHAASDTFTMQR
jgi:IPT/TIG domain